MGKKLFQVSTVLSASILRDSDELTIHLTNEYWEHQGLRADQYGCSLFTFPWFLGHMGFKNLPADYRAGGYATMNAVVGEWQAAGRPWHISFRTDKTMGMSSGSAESGNTNQVRFSFGPKEMS